MSGIAFDSAGVVQEQSVITEVKEWTNQLKDLTTEHDFTVCTEFVTLLGNIYDAWCNTKDETLKIQIVEAVDSQEGADVLVRIISVLSEPGDEYSCSTECYHKCYCILWDFSDASGSFVQNLMNTCIVGHCIDNLIQGESKESPENLEVIKASLGILYNISREENASSVLGDKTWSFLQPYKEGSDEYLKAMSAMILAFVSDENTEGIQGEKETTEYMVKLLEGAKDSPTRRNKQGFSCTELIEGLDRLALNDFNKQTVQKAGGVPLLMEFIQGSQPTEREAAAECIWTLAFDVSVQMDLQNFKTQLEDALISSTNNSLTKALKGVLMTLASPDEISQPETKVAVLDQKEKNKGHIMVSYSWDQGYGQRTARKIAANLKSRGFKIWIDVEEMKGSILDAMAEAVNNAYVFIMCVSDGYRKSNNCRLEAKYAYSHKKAIIPVVLEGRTSSKNDWLRLICSDQLYVDFTEGHKFHPRCDELVQQIDRITKEFDTVDVARPRLKRCNTQYATTDPSYWSMDDVTNWLLENDLESFSEKFRGVDGSTIQMLKKLQREAPEFFYRCLWECDNEKKRKEFINLLKLTKALDSL